MKTVIRRIFANLAPCEILGYTWCAVAYLILQTLPVQYPIAALLKQSLLPFWRYLIIVILGTVAVVVVRDLRRRKKGAVLQGLSFQYWAEIVRLVAAIMMASAFHFLLKASVFLINPVTWDRQLYNLDKFLHFGISPTLFLVELFNSPAAYHAIDVLYTRVYGIVAITYPPLIFALARRSGRYTLATGIMIMIIAGNIGYIALPSWGPVYTVTHEFEHALQFMPLTARVQNQLHQETVSVVRNPTGNRFIRYGGIAAFPSLHIAATFLYALASRSISRRWYHCNMAFVGCMMIGSVVTGYHYLIDGYAGLLLGYACFRAGKWWNPVKEETVASPVTRPPEQAPGTHALFD